MDKFYLVAIVLFAMQHYMIGCSVVDVIDVIDRERRGMSRVDYLELCFLNALDEHISRNVSFGVYDKYFDNLQFLERIWPVCPLIWKDK